MTHSLVLSIGFLTILMGLDYLSGLIKASYTKHLHSKIGYKGILKKAGMILAIFTMMVVDLSKVFGSHISFTQLIVTFFLINETLSIFENLSALGIQLPQSIQDFFQQK